MDNIITNINVFYKFIKINKKRNFDEISESTIQIRKIKYLCKRPRQTK
jgi:hypothetical protein